MRVIARQKIAKFYYYELNFSSDEEFKAFISPGGCPCKGGYIRRLHSDATHSINIQSDCLPHMLWIDQLDSGNFGDWDNPPGFYATPKPAKPNLPIEPSVMK